MSLNIQGKNDYSYLFSNLGGNSSSTSGSTFLSDYASIKNGSYAKLMKSYYSKDKTSTSSSTSSSTSKDGTNTLAKVQDASESLKKSADALLSKSLFAKKNITSKDENGVETTTNGYDVDAIYDAVSSFVKDYNSVIKSSDDVNSTSILGKMLNMTKTTASNEGLLSKIGVTINSDNTLSIDKDIFSKANMNTVQSLFNGSGSYGYQVSAKASLIDYAAEREANKSNTYSVTGNYASTNSTGNIFDGLF